MWSITWLTLSSVSYLSSVNSNWNSPTNSINCHTIWCNLLSINFCKSSKNAMNIKTNQKRNPTHNCVHQVKMMAFTYVAQNVIKRFYQIRNQLELCSHPTIPIHIFRKLCVGKWYPGSRYGQESNSTNCTSQIFHLWHAGCTASGACTSRVYLFQHTQSGAQGQERVRKRNSVAGSIN